MEDIRICDKCGKKYKRTFFSGTPYRMNQCDLSFCEDCRKLFKKWLKGEKD